MKKIYLYPSHRWKFKVEWISSFWSKKILPSFFNFIPEGVVIILKEISFWH